MYEDKEGGGGGQLLKGRTVLFWGMTEFRSGHYGLLRACIVLSGALLCCVGTERSKRQWAM